MARFVNEFGYLDQDQMVPGDRVRIDCRPYYYVFEMVEIGEERCLVLDLGASSVPEGLIKQCKLNRDLQEFRYQQDIEPNDMQIRLYSLPGRCIARGVSFSLYAMAPCADIANIKWDGEVYDTARVTDIGPPDLPYESPDAAIA